MSSGATKKKATAVVVGALIGAVLLCVVGLAIYNAGKERSSGAVICSRGKIVAMESSRSDSPSGPVLRRSLTIGRCSRISDKAFASAVSALAQESLSSTTRPPPTSPTTTPPDATSTTTPPDGRG